MLTSNLRLFKCDGAGRGRKAVLRPLAGDLFVRVRRAAGEKGVGENVMTAGYSGTPPAKKLGVKEGMSIVALSAPENYLGLVEPLPHDVRIAYELEADADIVHLFTNSRDELFRGLAKASKAIKQNGADLGFLVQESGQAANGNH